MTAEGRDESVVSNKQQNFFSPQPSSLSDSPVDQVLILDKVDNAIALFGPDGRLSFFNQKLCRLWNFSIDWLTRMPTMGEFLGFVVENGYWNSRQRQDLEQSLAKNSEDFVFPLSEKDELFFEIQVIYTFNGGHLFTFRDITGQRLAERKLTREVKRLRFLLGLVEQLQLSEPEGLQRAAKFALTYLTQAVNAAFGDVKVIEGYGNSRRASTLTNEVSAEFVACHGEPATAAMEKALYKGIPYGQGLLWQVVKTGKPIFVENYFGKEDAVPAFRHPSIGQLGIFPIPSAQGDIIGILTLESRTIDKLQEAPQQDMIEAACKTLGSTIERVQNQAQLQVFNRQLEQASRLKSEFLASMSHELRTPLNSILGFASLLDRQLKTQITDRQVEHLSTITRSGQHLLQLIDDILDLSKIEAGKMETEFKEVNVALLCKQCSIMIQPRANQKQIKLESQFDPTLTTFKFDDRRIRQIVINLLSNAVKFTPNKGSITLKANLKTGADLLQEQRLDDSIVDASTRYLCIEVEDTGIGIPEDRQHLLFRRFQQIDTALNRQYEGTGLGLALSKRLAELHGGTVSFVSEPGQGSSFRLWLPQFHDPGIEDIELSDYRIEDLASFEAHRSRILVVEDHSDSQVLMLCLLESEGYSVEVVSSGTSMQEKIRALRLDEPKPALIFMDVQLPGVDGLQLTQELKASPLWKDVPVVIVTALAMNGDRERCLAAGANAYISKPIESDELLELVASFTQQR